MAKPNHFHVHNSVTLTKMIGVTRPQKKMLFRTCMVELLSLQRRHKRPEERRSPYPRGDEYPTKKTLVYLYS